MLQKMFPMTLLARRRSVRSILTLWYSAVLLGAFAVFVVEIDLYLQRVLLTSLDENLLDEVDWIARLVDVDRMRFAGTGSLERLSADIEHRIMDHFTRGPRNYVVMLATTGGRVLYRSGSPTEAELNPGSNSDTSLVRSVDDPRGGRVRVASRRAAPLMITVGYEEHAINAVLDNLLSVVAILVPVALLMSLGGGYFMAGIALRPVHQIARLTDRITAESLDLRIPPRAVDDELGLLIGAINTMIARLQKSFGQIREFSLGVAHELRTPLTILKGEAELSLLNPAASADTQRLAALSLEETARMSRIVDDLLTLAKADASQINIEQDSVPLERLVAEVYEDALVLASDRTLQVELTRNEPATVLGDAARVRQLLRVLVANAVQYTDPGGAIRLSSVAGPSEVTVAVEDTGIGIPAECLDRVFDRFYRVDQARSRAPGGSGLGLTIARWIAEAHRGSISVSSTPGRGSCFTIRLPLFVAAPPGTGA
jgi:two-component system, OmpR family, sensor kinase